MIVSAHCRSIVPGMDRHDTDADTDASDYSTAALIRGSRVCQMKRISCAGPAFRARPPRVCAGRAPVSKRIGFSFSRQSVGTRFSAELGP